MALILSLETSTDVCSVALHRHGELIDDRVVREPQAHAARLAPLIEEILKSNEITPGVLGAVAVSSGPGSYTGLRIGASTAKGLCYGLDIPLITVPTLELMAVDGAANNAANGLLCPMIDARRMEVYCQLFSAEGTPIESAGAVVVDENSFRELLAGEKMLFFGNGAAKCRGVLSSPNALFLEGIFPNAVSLGRIAHAKFEAGMFTDVAAFKPFYLKEFVAKKSASFLN